MPPAELKMARPKRSSSAADAHHRAEIVACNGRASEVEITAHWHLAARRFYERCIRLPKLIAAAGRRSIDDGVNEGLPPSRRGVIIVNAHVTMPMTIVAALTALAAADNDDGDFMLMACYYSRHF